MYEERFATGTVLGTGSVINVICGFKPRYVKLLNVGSGNEETLEWTVDMGAGYGRKTTNDVSSILTSNGVTQYAGTDAQGSGQGFVIGADSDVNANGEKIVWLAVR